MTKFLFWGIVLFCGFTMLSFQATQDPEIEKARSWFQSHYSYPSYLGIEVTPDWLLARKINRSANHSYFEVPLNKLIIADIGNPGSSQNVANEFASANGYVKLIVENLFGEYVAYFVRLNGSRDFVAEFGRNAVQNTTFDKIDKHFGGSIEYIGMDGISIEGIIISNGIAIGKIKTQPLNPQVEEDATDRCWSCDVVTNTYWTVGGYQDASGNMQWTAPHSYYTTTYLVCMSYGAYCSNTVYGLTQVDAQNLAWMTYYQTGYLPGGPNTNIINPPIANCCEVPAMRLVGGTIENFWIVMNLNTQLHGIDCRVPSLSGFVSADMQKMILPTTYELTNNQVYMIAISPNPPGVCGHTVTIKSECDIALHYVVAGGVYAFGVTEHYEHIHPGVLLR